MNNLKLLFFSSRGLLRLSYDMSNTATRKNKKARTVLPPSNSLATREERTEIVLDDHSSPEFLPSEPDVETESHTSPRTKRKNRAEARKTAKPTNLEGDFTEVVEQRFPLNESTLEPILASDADEEILLDLPKGDLSLEGNIQHRTAALEEQAESSFHNETKYTIPSTYAEAATVYRLLRQSIRDTVIDPYAQKPKYRIITSGVLKHLIHSPLADAIGQEMSDDDRRVLLRGFSDNFIKEPQDAIWVFFPYVIDNMSATSFINFFKKRSFVVLFLEEYRDYLSNRANDGNWSVEPNGLTNLTKEFLSQDGMKLFRRLGEIDGLDERTMLFRPIKKKELVPSTITDNNNPTSNSRPNMIVQQAHDCTLKDLDKKSIEDFLDAIRRNQVQFPGWTYNRELIHHLMALRLDNGWMVHPDPHPSPGSKAKSWREISFDKFVSFLERIASSTDGKNKRDSILSELHRKIKGLFFDPLRSMMTLDQLVEFQDTLNKHRIVLNADEKRNIDNIIFDSLVYRHCSPQIKNIIKTLKSTLVYNETSQTFGLLKTAVMEAVEADQTGQKALDYFNVHDWEQARRGKSVSKASSDDTSNRQHHPPKENGKNNKRSSTQSQAQPANPSKPKDFYCGACGFKNHSFDKCRLLADPTIKRSLLNTNRNITFAESARGKYLVSLGLQPRFHADEVPIPGEKPEVSHSSKKSKPNGISSYLNTLINLDLPLIDVIIAAQGNRNLAKAKCLLDSGADVTYVSLDMINILNANKYLVSCFNCFTCTGAGDNCHSITGIANLTISYVNELSQHLTLRVRAQVVRGLKYDLIIGRSTIKKHNLVLQFPQHFLTL